MNEMSIQPKIEKCPICDVDLIWSAHNNKEYMIYCKIRMEKKLNETKKKKNIHQPSNNKKLTSFFKSN
jgi:hypothetical protein